MNGWESWFKKIGYYVTDATIKATFQQKDAAELPISDNFRNLVQLLINFEVDEYKSEKELAKYDKITGTIGDRRILRWMMIILISKNMNVQ